jgi:hypothetical protein
MNDFDDTYGDDDLSYLYDDSAGLDAFSVPEAQPNLDLEYAPTLSGEQAIIAAISLASTPQAQQAYAEHMAAEEEASRAAAAPVIHTHLDQVESKLGATLDRRAVIDRAEEILPDLVKEYGHTQQTAELALQMAARENTGKATYDDIINRISARAKR